MSKIIDVSEGGGDLVVIGKALVLPSSSTDGTDLPLDGSVRFNPESNIAEVFTEGSWAPLGDTGGAHSHTMMQITGLLDALAAKASSSHSHEQSDITGLISALSTKADTNHQHIIGNILNLQEDLDAKDSAITALQTGKANNSHNHVITSITGLQAALDSRSPVQHFHPITDIEGLATKVSIGTRHQFSICTTGKPTSNMHYVVTTAFRVDIPHNFAGSSVFVYAWPTSDYTINIRQNTEPCGSIVINTGGDVVMTTISPLGLILMPGDRLIFDFPAVTDTTLDTISMAILGEAR